MRNKYLILNVLFIMMLFVFIGCSDDDGDKKTINEFKLAAQLVGTYVDGGISLITATDLYNGLQSNPDNYYLIDIRSNAHYQTGHIAGALNTTAGAITDDIASLPTDKTIVVICYTGQSASQVSSYLNVLRYDAKVLQWGMCGWTNEASVTNSTKWLNLVPTDAALETTANDITAQAEQDYPVLDTDIEDAEEIIKESMDTYFDAGLHHISATDVWPNLSNYFIIDVRAQSYYDAGHIAGAFRVDMADLGYEENLKYLPTNQPILVVCYTAHTANHITSLLNMLGYDAYNCLYGMNGITANTAICKANYSAPGTNYPVVTGP